MPLDNRPARDQDFDPSYPVKFWNGRREADCNLANEIGQTVKTPLMARWNRFTNVYYKYHNDGVKVHWNTAKMFNKILGYGYTRTYLSDEDLEKVGDILLNQILLK